MAKRHIRRAFGGTYCGREITAKMVTVHPTETRKDDCVWCRRTYRAEVRDQRGYMEATAKAQEDRRG